jgi:hypothetical protein
MNLTKLYLLLNLLAFYQKPLFLIFLNSLIYKYFIEMSENEETSSSERVKGDEYVLKKANQANLREEEEKGTTVKVDVKEDATSEE